MRKAGVVFYTGVALLLAGCGDATHQDLQDYMAQVKARPAGEIEPIPTFKPYQTYKYSALALRSPFEPPLLQSLPDGSYGREAVAPDEARPKEFLETVNFSALSMVGTMNKDGVMWALVDDGAGGIHRVTVGNYLGKNHGKIVGLDQGQIEVVEIVPDGKQGWVERPRTLALREK
ncbi:MAG: pilus assembly protein PilP [Porticoccaceae bacterium]|nr:pilus assembly protein PilP [Porticoccaceae bacterium]